MRSALEEARERLARQKARLQELRASARDRYASGAAGLQVAALLCELTDRLLLDLFEEALAPLDPAVSQAIRQNTAIIAVGGSGRGELAPYSDADILFLHRPQTAAAYADVVAHVVRDCWDAGIRLGHSVRTVGNALSMARTDAVFATSLVEARCLWGDQRLFRTLTWRFYRRVVRGRQGAFYRACLEARGAERAQHGDTAQQLEPDLKRGAGGLRDLHLIRWIGYANYGNADIDILRLEGGLPREEAHALLAAHEFLTRIRVELHFAAGKAQEILSRAEQLRLAELYGYNDEPGRRGVERFMQVFFQHSTAIASIANRFVERHRPQPAARRLARWLLAHRSNQFYTVDPEAIDVPHRYRGTVYRDLEKVLHLYELAGLYSVSPTASLVDGIRRTVPHLPNVVSPAAAQRFLSILARPGNLGRVLRGMYEAGVLEKVVPEVTHAHCLLQFNQYHHYTVDEHTLRAIEAAERLDQASGSLGAAYREIRHKELLHLALLLHDLGKGFDEDHSDVGRRIAAEVTARLHMPQQAREQVMFLVHQHLAMSLLAFRRDLSDPQVLLRFSRVVGSPENLRMLYALTAADITAVGPGVWTEWKGELLADLYDRVMLILSGEHEHFGEPQRRLAVYRRVNACREAERAAVEPNSAPGAVPPQVPRALVEVLDAFPSHYLESTPAEQIAADIEVLAALPAENVVVRSRYEPATNTTEYRVYTRDMVGSGLFSKISGSLTAKRLEILAASICTTSTGLVVDSFRVLDSDQAGEPAAFRLAEVEDAIRDVLLGRVTVEDLLQRGKRFGERTAAAPLAPEPTRVVIDNDSSERLTIIDVFAHDRPGLLYAITTALRECRLSVALAKITTHLDQVLDVFYVTDRDGAKIRDESRLLRIRETLEQSIEAFEREALESAALAAGPLA